MIQIIQEEAFYALPAKEYDDRGLCAVVLAHHIDGNVCDVYGETEEDANAMARLIVSLLNQDWNTERQL